MNAHLSVHLFICTGMARLVYKSQALAAHAKEKADGLDWCGEFIAVRYPPE